MSPGLRQRRRRPAPLRANVFSLDAQRILRALQQRRRYRYVQPRVEPEGAGWKIVSPNCSRNIRADGGEIEIARLLPAAGGRWLLQARDHAQGVWQTRADDLGLADALARLCEDPAREFWP